MSHDVNKGRSYLMKRSYFTCCQSVETGDYGVPISQPSAFLLLGLHGPITVTLPGKGEINVRAAVWAPHAVRLRVKGYGCGYFHFDLAALSIRKTPLLNGLLQGREYVELPLERFEDLRPALDAALRDRLDCKGAVGLFEDVWERAFSDVTPEPDKQDSSIHQALDWIHANWRAEGFRVGELAEYIGLSEYSLMRRFRAEIGMPLRAYQQWLRALSLLRTWDSDASITELAVESGFYDAAHLNKAWIGWFGLPPSAYRNREYRLYKCE